MSRRRVPPRDPQPEDIRFYNTLGRYGYMSNFSRHAVMCGAGLTWPTAEHLFQAGKHREPLRTVIRQAPAPGDAKRIAWSRPHCSSWWDQGARDAVMLDVLRRKFAQHPHLARDLIATGDAHLIEAAPRDWYWGEGHDGTGLNRLGTLLMRVRAELRAGVYNAGNSTTGRTITRHSAAG